MFTTKGSLGTRDAACQGQGAPNCLALLGLLAEMPLLRSLLLVGARHFTLARWAMADHYVYSNRRGDKDRRFRASRENEMHGEVTFCQTGVALVRLFGGVYAPYRTGRAPVVILLAAHRTCVYGNSVQWTWLVCEASCSVSIATYKPS
jgi:hypothetical protein